MAAVRKSPARSAVSKSPWSLCIGRHHKVCIDISCSTMVLTSFPADMVGTGSRSKTVTFVWPRRTRCHAAAPVIRMVKDLFNDMILSFVMATNWKVSPLLLRPRTSSHSFSPGIPTKSSTPTGCVAADSHSAEIEIQRLTGSVEAASMPARWVGQTLQSCHSLDQYI